MTVAKHFHQPCFASIRSIVHIHGLERTVAAFDLDPAPSLVAPPPLDRCRSRSSDRTRAATDWCRRFRRTRRRPTPGPARSRPRTPRCMRAPTSTRSFTEHRADEHGVSDSQPAGAARTARRRSGSRWTLRPAQCAGPLLHRSPSHTGVHRSRMTNIDEIRVRDAVPVFPHDISALANVGIPGPGVVDSKPPSRRLAHEKDVLALPSRARARVTGDAALSGRFASISALASAQSAVLSSVASRHPPDRVS